MFSRRPAQLLVALVVAVAVISTGCSWRSDQSGDAPRAGEAVVTHVVDGDTVDVTIGGHSETIRLLGIDTPETVKPNSPVECYGPEASTRTKSLLPPGTKVLLTRDVEARDKYGRLLAYVTRSVDQLFVNLDLLRNGFARTLSIKPNTAHRNEFAQAAASAKAADLGLWSVCPPK